MKYFKILAVSVFVVGLGLFVYSVLPKRAIAASDVVIRSRTIEKNAKGQSRISIENVRYQRANGDWKEVQTFLDENGNSILVNTLYSDASGVYRVNDKAQKAMYLGARASNFVFDEQKIKQISDYIGEENIAGVRVVVVRQKTPDTTFETASAPELNGLFLREKKTSEDGETVTEAYSVERRPISDSEFGKRPDYPVDMSSFERKTQAMEKAQQK